MSSLIIEISNQKTLKLIAELAKQLGATVRIETKDDETKMSKETFEAKLKRAKSDSGTILKTKEDVNAFFDSL